MSLVDNVFDNSTIAALKSLTGTEQTIDFMQIIRNWWDIVNTKNLFKGVRKRSEFCRPFNDITDNRLEFLEKFVEWLKIWNTNTNNNSQLTKDTFTALCQSTSAIVQFIKYSLSELKISYVLPGMLQTDDLERRFGRYRNLSGCTYHVSLNDLLESEKKIRIQNIFRHHSDDYTELKFSENQCNNIASIFSYSPSSDYLENCKIDKSAQIYACGYGSHSISKKLNCQVCKSLIVLEKGTQIDDTYFDHLQRGGLSVPTDEVCEFFYHMSAIFQDILSNDSVKLQFFKQNNQKDILSYVTINCLESNNFLSRFDYECFCGRYVKSLFYLISSPFTNIILNNYVKSVNNEIVAKSSHSAATSTATTKTATKRKIQTFSQSNTSK